MSLLWHCKRLKSRQPLLHNSLLGKSTPIPHVVHGGREPSDRLKTICPRGTFYHGPLLQKNGQECKTAEEYDEATLATRDFWFQPPIRYEQAWAPTLATYREHIEPWPEIPEPTTDDYTEHLLLTKDSAPGPDGLPYAFWRMFPEQSAAVLQDDFDRMMSCELPAPTQVGVWIPKAKQGPTADYFQPLGTPDALDRLQDGTAAAILFRTTRSSFHPAQTMLNEFREPQRAVLYLLTFPRHLSESMPIGSCKSCIYGSALPGYCSWLNTSCLGEESDTKCKEGCSLHEKSSRG